MNLDILIPFWMKHNATIIEALIGTSLLVTAFLSIRSFMAAKDPGSSSSNAQNGSSLDIQQLESTLKQILEKAGQVPSVAAASSGQATATSNGSGNSEEAGKLLAEITFLKSDLQSKQKQIEELKVAAPTTSAPAGMSDADRSKLQNQLGELQSKLTEYEIISEDIADLSFYKEQNAKLQKELEALKGSGATPAAVPQAAAAVAEVKAEPQIVGISNSPEPVEDSPVEVSEEDSFGLEVVSAQTTSSEPLSTEQPIDTSVDDDLMAEFNAAVEKQRLESGQPPLATADLGQLDMDKMISEAALISTDGPEVDAASALGSGLDENKLLQEAAAFEAVSNEDKKLMGQFENFVKKSE